MQFATPSADELKAGEAQRGTGEGIFRETIKELRTSFNELFSPHQSRDDSWTIEAQRSDASMAAQRPEGDAGAEPASVASWAPPTDSSPLYTPASTAFLSRRLNSGASERGSVPTNRIASESSMPARLELRR